MALFMIGFITKNADHALTTDEAAKLADVGNAPTAYITEIKACKALEVAGHIELTARGCLRPETWLVNVFDPSGSNGLCESSFIEVRPATPGLLAHIDQHTNVMTFKPLNELRECQPLVTDR